jgi:hypothetical protein
MRGAILWIRERPGLGVLLAFLVCIAVIRPFGEVFYGGDDWAYAWSARHLVETGQLRLSDWVTATGAGQTLWAGLLASIFGFSLRILNLSTLLVAAAGVVGLYRLGRELELSPSHAAVVTTGVVTTPFFLGFASSFMTDMFYTVMAIFALLFYVRGLRNGSLLALMGGSVFCAVAYLNRQIGLAILIVFGAVSVLRWLRYEKGAVVALLAGGTLPAIVVGVAALRPIGGRTIAQQILFGQFAAIVNCLNPSVTAIRLARASAYVACALLPISIVFSIAARNEMLTHRLRRLVAYAVPGGLWLLGTALLAFRGNGLSVRGDLLDVGFVAQNQIGWTVLCLVAIVPAAALLFPAIESIIAEQAYAEPAYGWTLIAGCGAVHLVATVIFPTFVNNYFLPLLPMAALLLSYPARAFALPLRLSVLTIVASAAISIVLIESHDRYIEAAWRWADAAARQGKLTEVYGEPSWCFWRRYDELMQTLRATAKEGGDAIWAPRQRLQREARFIIRRRPEEVAFEFPDGSFAPYMKVEYSTLAGMRQATAYRR